ncbi:hypothetical protein MKW92_017250 [Papaver armeniacum]|nr:hypothetical protein MKW92_017250 [Papaver armeniacum]
MVLSNDIDLPNPPAELRRGDTSSPTTVFSHSQTVVVCGNCQTVLCQPTGGKARLTEDAHSGRRRLIMLLKFAPNAVLVE